MQAFSWPLVALILGLVAIFVFRTQLSLLLGRARKIGPFETSIGQQEPTRVSPTDEWIEKTLGGPLVEERNKSIQKEFDSRQISPTERERLLLLWTAGATLALQFERAYLRIYGSQLSALQHFPTRHYAQRDNQSQRPDPCIRRWRQSRTAYDC